MGAFLPSADSNLFRDDQDLYFVSKDDFIGFTGGVEYNVVLANNVEIGLHFDGYGRTVDTSYRDYTWDDDAEIQQSLRFQVFPFGASIRLVPTSRRAKVAPYLAGGPDLFYWKYEEFGDFIDFFDPDLPVYGDHFVSDGVTFGAHVAGGLRFYLNRDFALVFEGRYQWAKTEMGDDFQGEPGNPYEIDLGGPSFTVGLHVRF